MEVRKNRLYKDEQAVTVVSMATKSPELAYFMVPKVSFCATCASGMFSGQQSGELPLLAAAAVSLIDVPSQSFRNQIDRQNGYLRQFGLARRAVMGDGNCLFRAVSYGLLQSEDFHGDLRQSAINFMQTNLNYLQSMFEEPGMDFQEELNTLAQDGSYAGQE
ncbi:hypothetical protein FSP39_006036 [Pinctada imbricata]|uniref:OTU domain-containing protein n=1 Tax=Pinctada imbricata TaxID=66713 RepID=A0AA88YFU9_PINIB|nr:hypothetical protein FSP39_006036 [Pinctada imbricata]